VYTALLIAHSIIRWLVVVSLLIAIIRTYRALTTNAPFTATDNAIRHWTATFTHIQLMVGYALYFISPLIKAFYANKQQGLHNGTLTFFSVIHLLLMTTAIVIITIGSARAKRQSTDHAKHKTMLTWFTAGFAIIFIAIPWPFSPLTQRPWLRPMKHSIHQPHAQCLMPLPNP
jgi:hypothetical protein